MKIIHCLNHYLPDHIAGTEVYTAALAKALVAAGCECRILIPNYGKSETERYQYEAVEVIKYAEPSLPDRGLITGARAPEGLPFFMEILKEEQPDIVHFHELAGSNGLSLYHVKAAKAGGYKTVMTFHVAKYSCATGTLMYMNKTPCDGIIRTVRCSKCRINNMGVKGLRARILSAGFSITNSIGYDTTKWNNTLGTALGMPFIIKKLKADLHALIDATDAAIPLTEWYRDVLIRNEVSPASLHIIKQALPNEITAASKPEKESRLRLVFVGRINHFKGVLTLINAVRQINPEKVMLDIYGRLDEDEYGKDCMQAAAGAGNISFKGTVPPQHVVNTIGQYDVLCLPSEVCEMAPLVIQEAYAAGVPVLASDVYGNAEMISPDKNGWLFTFKDGNDLRRKIQELADDLEKIKKATQQITPPENFSYVSEKHLQLYLQLLKIG